MADEKERFNQLATLMRCAASELQYLYMEGSKKPEDWRNADKRDSLRNFLEGIQKMDDLADEDGALRQAIAANAEKGAKTKDPARLESLRRRETQRFVQVFERAKRLLTEVGEQPDSLFHSARFADVQSFQDESRLIVETYVGVKEHKEIRTTTSNSE